MTDHVQVQGDFEAVLAGGSEGDAAADSLAAELSRIQVRLMQVARKGQLPPLCAGCQLLLGSLRIAVPPLQD